MASVTGSRSAALRGRHSVIATLRAGAAVLVLAGAVAVAVAFTFTAPTSVVADYSSECQNPTQT